MLLTIGNIYLSEVFFRASSTKLRASSFLICLASPVLHKMLCWGFSESKSKRLTLDDVDGGIFIKALDVWRGKRDCQELELGEVQQLALVADRFQMHDVLSVLEEALMGQRTRGLRGRSGWKRDAGGCGYAEPAGPGPGCSLGVGRAHARSRAPPAGRTRPACEPSGSHAEPVGGRLRRHVVFATL